jgi:hypothetical protein
MQRTIMTDNSSENNNSEDDDRNYNHGQACYFHYTENNREICKKIRIIVKMVLMTSLGPIVGVLTSSYLYQPITGIPKIVGGHKSECRYVIYYM